MFLSEKAITKLEHLSGERATQSDIDRLSRHLPLVSRAEFLLYLFAAYSVIGVEFSLSEQFDASGIGVELKWMTANQVVDEALNCQPGISVCALGLFPVGICLLGSGDPYFVDLRNSACHSIVRVPHAYAVHKEYPVERVDFICGVNDFFENSVV